MTDLRKAAEMALEALEYYRSGEDYQPTPASEAIHTLRQALAQPEQEPDNWWDNKEYVRERFGDNAKIISVKRGLPEGSFKQPQPEQEPVAWEKNYDIACSLLKQAHDILATTQYPIKRHWVSLTDEEIQDFGYEAEKFDKSNSEWFDRFGFAHAIEAALKEKNT